MTRDPLPDPSSLTEGFWAAARRHELVIQRCDGCGRWRHYPQPYCPECLHDSWSWAESSGSGVIHSFSITHRAFNPTWAERVPYAVVTIDLDEGVRVVSDLLDTDLSRVAIGGRVEVFFEDIDERVTLPRFRLVGDTDR